MKVLTFIHGKNTIPCYLVDLGEGIELAITYDGFMWFDIARVDQTNAISDVNVP